VTKSVKSKPDLTRPDVQTIEQSAFA